MILKLSVLNSFKFKRRTKQNKTKPKHLGSCFLLTSPPRRARVAAEGRNKARLPGTQSGRSAYISKFRARSCLCFSPCCLVPASCCCSLGLDLAPHWKEAPVLRFLVAAAGGGRRAGWFCLCGRTDGSLRPD